jgi:hypothetical protein
MRATEGDCTFQLQSMKDPEIEHFIQIGTCYPYDLKGRPTGLEKCKAVSIIRINGNQMTLRDISFDRSLYKNDDYVVKVKKTDRDCREVLCTQFTSDAVLTVKKGSLQETFNMQGNCYSPEEYIGP